MTLSAEAGSYLLTLSLPARSTDWRSLGKLVSAIGQTYATGSPGDEEIAQWSEVAAWRKELLTSPETRVGRDFWSKYCWAMEIDTWKSAVRSIPVSFAGRARIDGEILFRLNEFCAGEGVSHEDLFLSAWLVLLSRLTGLGNIPLGVEWDGRPYADFAAALGPFAQYLPYRSNIQLEAAFRACVGEVSSSLRDVRAWQLSYPGFEQMSALPLFDYGEVPGEQVYGGVRFRVLRQESWRPGGQLRLSVRRGPGEVEWELHGGPSEWAACLGTLLEKAIESPDTPVGRLALLDSGQRRRMLVEWNQTGAEYPREKCIHELIEMQVERTPEREAVRCGEVVLSYGELNRRSNQLAHYLRRLGVGPDRRVGLCLERRVELLVGLLGILKAGGAYVPLNGQHPVARLARQLHGAEVVLTEAGLVERIPEFGGRVLCLDRDGKLWEGEPEGNPELRTTPENLAYVLSTSGSTGEPKGVAVRHRNLVNYSWFARRMMELEKYPEGLHFGMVSTICADVGITCIYPALVSGGCLHLISQEVATDSEQMGRYASRHGLDVLKIVPSHLAALLEGKGGKRVLPSRYLVVGGEKLKRELVEQVEAAGAGCEVINHYAPTETTCGSLTLKLSEFDWKSWSGGRAIPLGRPIWNTRLYVLDSGREPVPVGVTGELYISGDGVSAGYADDSERTAERFMPDPFHAGATMYRSGDLVRYLSDGTVEFIERADDQVKIRGYRVELEEVEWALKGYAGVKQAVTLAREDERGEKRLLGYVVGEGGARLEGEQIREYLKGRLPDYMVPVAVMVLAQLPLNANGKVDRQSLPEPEVGGGEQEVPRGGTEEALAAIWKQVLKREQIGAEENFFDIGGHSLSATQIAVRVRDRLGVSVAVRTIFDCPTIRSLAEAIDSNHDAWLDLE